jgi:hypothetical protein
MRKIGSQFSYWEFLGKKQGLRTDRSAMEDWFGASGPK